MYSMLAGACALCLQCQTSRITAPYAVASTPVVQSTAYVAVRAEPDTPADTLAETDPEAFLRMALQRYQDTVQSYECTFYKQEFVQGKMTKLQEIRVKFLDDPYSVFMHWQENAGLVERVLYVDGEHDNKALVKVSGLLQLIVPGHLKRDVTGEEAMKLSRRQLNEFGFEKTLEGILEVNEQASAKGDLDFRYTGTGTIDGRPTYVYERRLPADVEYSDPRLVLHIDQEWWLPTGTFLYGADDQLLGQYVLADVQLNTGLTSENFTPKSAGL